LNIPAAAIIIEMLVNKFTAVKTEQAERQSLFNAMYGSTNTVLTFSPHYGTFRPHAGNIHRSECVQVKAIGTLTAVGYQIHFQETGFVLLPLGEGPDRYGILQQTSRFGGGQSSSASQPPPGSEQTVDGSRTHLTKLGFQRKINMLLSVLSKYSYHLRNKRLQSFGA
jgi:hypothetical protein